VGDIHERGESEVGLMLSLKFEFCYSRPGTHGCHWLRRIGYLAALVAAAEHDVVSAACADVLDLLTELLG